VKFPGFDEFLKKKKNFKTKEFLGFGDFFTSSRNLNFAKTQEFLDFAYFLRFFFFQNLGR